MTPRSGWYACSSERGGGIACWLEVMRALAATPARRSVLFVASSGHELGHLGIDAYIARRSGIVGNTIAWVHLGANIGAATDKTTLLQSADDEIDAAATGALKSVGVDVTIRAPRGSVPAGEAEAVHRGAGRYVSFIGGNALFHHVDDVGATATDRGDDRKVRRGTDCTHPRARVGSVTAAIDIETVERHVLLIALSWLYTDDLTALFRFRAIRPRCGRPSPRHRRLRSLCGRSRAEHPRWYRGALSR